MKCSLHSSLFALLGLGLLLGCRESDLLVTRDDDAPPQVIVITRDVAEDPRPDPEEAAKTFPPSDVLDPMRLLWIQTYETMSPNGVYAHARASFWTLLDSTTGASAGYEEIRLGGVVLPLLDPDCEEKQDEEDNEDYEELCWVMTMDGTPLNVYANDAEIADFTGGTPRFEATGDSELRDVTFHPEIPRSNRMMDVEPGTRVDVTHDWTIRLDYAVHDPVLFIKPQTGPYLTSDETNVYLETHGEVDRITVPRTELARLRDAGAEQVWVSLYVNPAVNPLGHFTLHGRDDDRVVSVGVAMKSFHNVWGVELVD